MQARNKKNKKVGDWIAGFSSSKLNQLAQKSNVKIVSNALIWIGCVSEILPMEKYYSDPRFSQKIPFKNNGKINSLGDNIYKYNGVNFEQVSNKNHDNINLQHDISGLNVLIFKEYYYLGQNGIIIPENFNISIPKGPTLYGNKNTNIGKMINWVRDNDKFKQRINGNPCLWNEIKNKEKSSCERRCS
jgi:hypothetical protein